MMLNRKLTIFSWSMYDFANTIFAMNVTSLYFALWVTVDMKGEDILYSWALSGSMLLAALSAPLMGAISDRVGRRIPFLIIFTLICCIFTALIGLTNRLFFGLLLFAIANFCYQIAAIFYNALLPQMSGKGQIGRVSGYGTSLGYCGTIAGLLLVRPFVLKYGSQAAFIPTAILFLLFSLPCFLFVKDCLVERRDKPCLFLLRGLSAKQKGRGKFEPQIRGAFRKIKETFVNIKRYPDLFNFLIAAIFAFNAINTIIVFMSVYTKKVMGFTDPEIITFYIVSTIFAIIGSFIAGFITDSLGSKRTLSIVLGLWCISILLTVIAFNKIVFWAVGPLVGICLGATWTSARALVVDLSPPQMVGEVFGFYGLTGKSASIIGPFIWGADSVGVWFFRDFKVSIGNLCLIAIFRSGISFPSQGAG
ncbi:MAG: MFS transporter [Candidatus Kaelpia imicola]|nr:MFS transporter [Candidatus Kaelpia imicola]